MSIITVFDPFVYGVDTDLEDIWNFNLLIVNPNYNFEINSIILGHYKNVKGMI